MKATVVLSIETIFSLQDFQLKEQQVEDQKIEYAVQLVQTNKCQSEYYECELPATLDRIQKICEGQSLYFASVMIRYKMKYSKQDREECHFFWPQLKCHNSIKTKFTTELNKSQKPFQMC